MTTMVVTYQHAYIGGTTDLCERHAEAPPSWVASLGPVSHGAREGTCDACMRIAAREGVIADAGAPSRPRYY